MNNISSNNEKTLVYIPVDELYPHPDNPRKNLGDLQELTDSIKAKGVMQNLTVVPGHILTDDEWSALSEQYKKSPCEDLRVRMNNRRSDVGYTVIIGHRRCAAAKLAGIKELPCIIADMTPAEQVQTMLLENMQRSDLTVYEQAQGFQMMMDFGDTVESISDKTGFSKSTVRRRLKMSELNQETLKKVSSERQLSLMDFDRLSEVEDIKARNAILKEIGTNNFENKLSQALAAQKEKKCEKMWTDELKKYGAIEIPKNDKWDSKYAKLPYVSMSEDPKMKLKELLVGDEPFYYCIDYGTLYLRAMKTISSEDEAKKAAEEEQREKEQIRQNAVKEISQRMFNLRLNFVKGISETSAKKFSFVVIAAMVKKYWTRNSYVNFVHDIYAQIIGAEIGEDADIQYDLVQAETENSPYRAQLAFVYTLLSDSEHENCFDWKGKYTVNDDLEAIYEFLVSIGYEMSDEERSLMDGTHELYFQETSSVSIADEKKIAIEDSCENEDCVDDVSETESLEKNMLEQLRAVYGENR